MRGYRNAAIVIWFLGCAGGLFYARQAVMPAWVAVPALAALLVEISLYAGLGFEAVRRRLEAMGAGLPAWMAASALVPYAIFGIGTGTLQWRSLALLAALAAAVSWWFVALPRRRAFDALFLAMMAGVHLAKLFRGIYISPLAELQMEVLGQLMWIRLGLAAALLIRRVEGTGFGFLPVKRDWAVGLRHYLCFLPLGLVLMLGLGFARWGPAEGLWWKAPATFIGILWVVALGEEFFFRGMLQQWLVEWMGNRGGVAATALVFGAAHLPFREFPNWEFAALAAVAGWFYGRACLAAGGIRAAMVTHALVVTTWRVLFR